MNSDLNGTWCCQFISPAKGIHDFALVLKQDSGKWTAQMQLVRRDPNGRILNVAFRTHVEVCDKYVALLSKDAAKDSSGLNAMVLEATDNKNVMRGRIIWNSISEKIIQEGTLEWQRKA